MVCKNGHRYYLLISNLQATNQEKKMQRSVKTFCCLTLSTARADHQHGFSHENNTDDKHHHGFNGTSTRNRLISNENHQVRALGIHSSWWNGKENMCLWGELVKYIKSPESKQIAIDFCTPRNYNEWYYKWPTKNKKYAHDQLRMGYWRSMVFRHWLWLARRNQKNVIFCKSYENHVKGPLCFFLEFYCSKESTCGIIV